MRINKPTLTFFVVVWVVYNLAGAYVRPASTLRGFVAGIFFSAGVWAIYLIWRRPGKAVDNDDDSDDGSEPRLPVHPPARSYP